MMIAATGARRRREGDGALRRREGGHPGPGRGDPEGQHPRWRHDQAGPPLYLHPSQRQLRQRRGANRATGHRQSDHDQGSQVQHRAWQGFSPQFRLLEVDDLRSASLKIIGTVLSNGNVSTATNDEGGAILLGRHGALVVRSSTLSSNSAVNGGAINTGGAHVKIVDSTLRANRAVLVDGVGGAVIAFGAPVTIDSSVVTNNRSSGGGGGISRPASWRPSCPAEDHRQHRVEQQHHRKRRRRHLRLRPREADHPSQRDRRQQAREHRPSGDGGRIWSQGRMTISKSTISGNVAGGPGIPNAVGGAIVNATGGTGTINATTIAGNRALGPGASGGGIAHGSALTLKATIVALSVKADPCAIPPPEAPGPSARFPATHRPPGLRSPRRRRNPRPTGDVARDRALADRRPWLPISPPPAGPVLASLLPTMG